ncbi:MAG: hypothetical protein K8U57_30500 [Planctomycetes bacterium]|nr:hypothetical protein [Planctomycetota bacterium]
MRVEGWELLLAEHVREAYGRRFQWGEHDCVLWAGRWVRLCTGKDLIAEWEGKYKTEAGARRIMKKLGYAVVADAVDDRLNPIPVALAKRGDILLGPSGALGVCFGRHGFFPGPDDVTMADTLTCPRAWAV